MTRDPASLSNLRGLALPPPISWWPPQPGWWILLAGIVGLAAVAITRLVQIYRRSAYRREALGELRDLERQSPALLAPALVTLIKRTALVAYPRHEVAGLTGSSWVRFLAGTGRSSMDSNASWEAVRRASLDPDGRLTEGEARAAIAGARLWIRRHRVDPRP